MSAGQGPNLGGLDEVVWAPRVNPSLIRRLYETDAQGIVDDDLINNPPPADWYRVVATCLIEKKEQSSC